MLATVLSKLLQFDSDTTTALSLKVSPTPNITELDGLLRLSNSVALDEHQLSDNERAKIHCNPEKLCISACVHPPHSAQSHGHPRR